MEEENERKTAYIRILQSHRSSDNFQKRKMVGSHSTNRILRKTLNSPLFMAVPQRTMEKKTQISVKEHG